MLNPNITPSNVQKLAKELERTIGKVSSELSSAPLPPASEDFEEGRDPAFEAQILIGLCAGRFASQISSMHVRPPIYRDTPVDAEFAVRNMLSAATLSSIEHTDHFAASRRALVEFSELCNEVLKWQYTAKDWLWEAENVSPSFLLRFAHFERNYVRVSNLEPVRLNLRSIVASLSASEGFAALNEHKIAKAISDFLQKYPDRCKDWGVSSKSSFARSEALEHIAQVSYRTLFPIQNMYTQPVLLSFGFHPDLESVKPDIGFFSIPHELLQVEVTNNRHNRTLFTYKTYMLPASFLCNQVHFLPGAMSSVPASIVLDAFDKARLDFQELSWTPQVVEIFKTLLLDTKQGLFLSGGLYNSAVRLAH